jgi:adenosylcobinamide-GDP ribazoletransferase
MRRQSRAFLLSMGFLSRLGPAMSASTQDMRLACVYYPAVGAVLGCLMTLPFSLGCFAGFSWIQAWLYVLLSLWLTRAMHLDGLADLLDALGSAKDGEAFQAVLKDSRIGAFACIGLLMALGGQIILAAACFEQGSFLPLAYAPVFGRCLPVVLAHIAPANPGAQLGALLADCPRASALLFALLCLFGVFFCLPLPGPLFALVLAAACLGLLRRVALRQGGYNGDFCGFAIVAGETAVLLAALV